MRRFTANRSLSLEARIRMLEDWAVAVDNAAHASSSQANGAGAGAAGLAGAVPSSPPATLAGDVTGTLGANTVKRIQNKPVDVPLAGDDQQYAQYDHVSGTIRWESLVPGLAYIDRSVAVTTGGTAQQLMAAQATRKTVCVINTIHNTEIIWVNAVGGTAAVEGLGSIPIVPGGCWEPLIAPLGAISILAPTTGTKVTAWEAI